MKMQPPKTAAQIVLALAHGAMHSDNLGEFINCCLRTAWRDAGLPGDLPQDNHGFITVPMDSSTEYQAIAPGFDTLAQIDVDSERLVYQPALFIMCERSGDPGRIARAAQASGLEAYDFRHDVVVAMRARFEQGSAAGDGSE